MPVTISLEPGERMYLDSQEFALGVTDRAIFIPKKKLWARNDPWYMQRVPHSQVRSVTITRLRSLPLLVLAATMVAIGALTTFLMVRAIITQQPGRVSGIPIGVLVAGLAIPFLLRGRYGIVIDMTGDKFRWKPPLVLDRASRNEIRLIYEMTVSACRTAGINVVDHRTPAA